MVGPPGLPAIAPLVALPCNCRVTGALVRRVLGVHRDAAPRARGRPSVRAERHVDASFVQRASRAAAARGGESHAEPPRRNAGAGEPQIAGEVTSLVLV